MSTNDGMLTCLISSQGVRLAWLPRVADLRIWNIYYIRIFKQELGSFMSKHLERVIDNPLSCQEAISNHNRNKSKGDKVTRYRHRVRPRLAKS